MLRGIPDIIGSDLLKALADTGHGDLIVIADHFYPHVTKCPNGVSIQAKGVGAVQMLDAILQLVPLDVEYEKQPIQYIVPDADSGIVVETNPVWDAVKETVKKHGYDTACIGTIERSTRWRPMPAGTAPPKPRGFKSPPSRCAWPPWPAEWPRRERATIPRHWPRSTMPSPRR